MNRRLMPLVLDVIFIFLASGVAAFAVMRFYIDSLWLCLILSAIFGLLIAILYRSFAMRRSAAYDLKRKDAEMMERVMSSLCIMSDEELNAYFKDLFSKMRLPFREEDGMLILEETNTAVRYYFTFSPSYEGKIIEMYKQTGKGQKLIVLGREFPEELYKLTDRFAGRIILVNGAELFMTMKRYELLPAIKPELSFEKPSFNLPRALFSKKRAKQYFLYGLTLEFFSFFVFYPIYYVCFGTALIVFSIICHFFGIREVKSITENPFNK